MRPAVLPVVVSFVAAAVLVAGCTPTPTGAPNPTAGPGATADPDPGRFNLEGGVPVGCMTHQTITPGVDYTDPALVSIFRSLPVLKYYVSNGSKGYCDGAGPTADDWAWAQWSADESSNRAPVAAILDAPPSS